MRYGVTLQGVIPPAEFGELAKHVEELGYDNLWITDSSLHAGDVYVYMTTALAATSRLVVGSAVTNPLTRHAGITANAFRSLAQLAPGRVNCGIAVGDRPLLEFEMKMAKLRNLTETIEALRRLWAGEEISGEFGSSRFEGAKLLSPAGDLPVYIAASGPKTLTTTGRVADGVILLAGLFPEAIEFANQRLDEGRAESSRPSFDRTAFLYGAIDEDRQYAIDVARPIVAWFPQTAPEHARLAGMSQELIDKVVEIYQGGEFQHAGDAAKLISDDFVTKVAFAGTPADVGEKVDWLETQQLDSLTVFPLGDVKTRLRTIEHFAEVAIRG
ncbi:MAG: LLM class flavin-dependent oxidoreductase [Actinobacteria bacterium]|nr:LLM class flavin-dependent oxidoreductase [Actinomycetota bacterium]